MRRCGVPAASILSGVPGVPRHGHGGKHAHLVRVPRGHMAPSRITAPGTPARPEAWLAPPCHHHGSASLQDRQAGPFGSHLQGDVCGGPCARNCCGTGCGTDTGPGAGLTPGPGAGVCRYRDREPCGNAPCRDHLLPGFGQWKHRKRPFSAVFGVSGRTMGQTGSNLTVFVRFCRFGS